MDQPVVPPSTPGQAEYRRELVALMPRLRRFARALTRNDADSDDLLQATLERALVHVSQWQPGSRLDSWLYRIAQNLWIDQCRRASTRGIAVDLEQLDALASGDGHRQAELELNVREVHQAMTQLPPEQQAVLAAVAVDGRTYGEAAQLLDIPIGTVMSRLARARGSLAEMLEHAPGGRS